jgi:hypothetical protein
MKSNLLPRPVLAAAVLLAGCAAPRSATEKMMWSTYPVATLKGEATSFVVRCSAPGKEGMVTVFTPAHVLETIGRGPLIMGLHRKGHDGGMETVLLMLLPERKAGAQRFYVRHPTQDLAAFRLQLPEAAAKVARLDSVLNERVLQSGNGSIHVGDEVLFLGYPNVCPETKGAFAVLRSGRISSYPATSALGQGMFLIDADVYPGDSGAPVFLASRNSSPKLVGVLTSRFALSKGAFSHLAAALDVNALRETLALLEHVPPVIASEAR